MIEHLTLILPLPLLGLFSALLPFIFLHIPINPSFLFAKDYLLFTVTNRRDMMDNYGIYTSLVIQLDNFLSKFLSFLRS